MRTYIVFAGGYGRTRSLLGRPLLRDEKVGKDIVASDCIIAVDGLNEAEMFPPLELKRRNIWYCKTCEQVIPESMMEKKIDCYFHDKEVAEKQDLKVWPNGYEEYTMGKRKHLKPMYRVWVSHNEGRDKLTQLWGFITTHHPYNKPIPLPVPVAYNRLEVRINDADDIPVIRLDTVQEDGSEIPAEVKESKHICSICDKPFQSKRALSMHKTVKHKE